MFFRVSKCLHHKSTDATGNKRNMRVRERASSDLREKGRDSMRFLPLWPQALLPEGQFYAQETNYQRPYRKQKSDTVITLWRKPRTTMTAWRMSDKQFNAWLKHERHRAEIKRRVKLSLIEHREQVIRGELIELNLSNMSSIRSFTDRLSDFKQLDSGHTNPCHNTKGCSIIVTFTQVKLCHRGGSVKCRTAVYHNSESKRWLVSWVLKSNPCNDCVVGMFRKRVRTSVRFLLKGAWLNPLTITWMAKVSSRNP